MLTGARARPARGAGPPRRRRRRRKPELLAEVWGFDFEGDENIVEVYVGYLRSKIDRPFGRNSLQTVRTIGYRLVDDAA